MRLAEVNCSQPRSQAGVFLSPCGPEASALERFAAKCRFEPTTGCVIWTGGTTAGQGNSVRYGSFWDAEEKRRWSAHRWAAKHIHGLDIDGFQVGHCCPHTGGHPNSLCVQHVEAQTQLENLAEENERRRWVQSSNERQYWLFVSLGIKPPKPQPVIELDAVPFFEMPKWLAALQPKNEMMLDLPF